MHPQSTIPSVDSHPPLTIVAVIPARYASTRLPGKAGVVQASGDPDNLAVVVLWMPVDQQKKRIEPGSRGYLDALVRMFLSENEPVALWLDQVLQRALSEGAGNSHLESQLFDTYQLKAMYVPSMSPPMLSLIFSISAE